MSRVRRRPRWMGVRLLGLVVLLYLGLALAGSPGALKAWRQSLEILETLLPILGVVVFIAGGINYLLDPRSLAKHLGDESGARGWMIALGAGVLSHGPMYAWYPVIAELRRHGMRDGLVAAFFYARAIKVPLLPMMAAYFGVDFTVILTLLTLLAAWGQGMMLEAFSCR